MPYDDRSQRDRREEIVTGAERPPIEIITRKPLIELIFGFLSALAALIGAYLMREGGELRPKSQNPSALEAEEIDRPQSRQRRIENIWPRSSEGSSADSPLNDQSSRRRDHAPVRPMLEGPQAEHSTLRDATENSDSESESPGR